MTVQEAYDITEAMIVGEEEAANHGNAYLDDFQIEALRTLLDACNEALAATPHDWEEQ